MNKHTSGPWHAIKYATRTEIVTRRKAQRRWTAIALVYGTHDDDSEQADANAHLIAAAPELLEALQAVLTPTGWANLECGPNSTHSRALAAIAKATGDA